MWLGRDRTVSSVALRAPLLSMLKDTIIKWNKIMTAKEEGIGIGNEVASLL